MKNSILTDDEMDSEIEGETASEEWSTKMSDVRVKQVLLCAEGSEDIIGNKIAMAYTFSYNAGPQFNLLPDAEPMGYFILFFNDELLNNIVIETKRYACGPFGVAGLTCQFLK
jgi:hypothetical protein